MGRRLELQALLEGILDAEEEADGDKHVYFQPPADLVMKYPCIVYARDPTDTKYADNIPYAHTKRYSVTYMDRNPDSDVPDKLGALPMCIHNRSFVTDNLNHDVFNLYF